MISWQQVIDAEMVKAHYLDNAVLLSFDDGYETMYNVVFPLLKAYNYPAVFAPVTGWLDTPADQKIAYADKNAGSFCFCHLVASQRNGTERAR